MGDEGLATSGAKSTSTSQGFVQLSHHGDLGCPNRNDQELQQTVMLGPAVALSILGAESGKPFSSVVGVDDSAGVVQFDTELGANTGSRKHKCHMVLWNLAGKSQTDFHFFPSWDHPA